MIEGSGQARVIVALVVSIGFLAVRLSINPLRKVEDSALATMVDVVLITTYVCVLLLNACEVSAEACSSFGFGHTATGAPSGYCRTQSSSRYFRCVNVYAVGCRSLQILCYVCAFYDPYADLSRNVISLGIGEGAAYCTRGAFAFGEAVHNFSQSAGSEVRIHL
eukprot:1179643-Prymnesium_polylepis.1